MSRRAGYLHSATNIFTFQALNQFVTIMMVLPLNGLLTSYIIWVWSSIYWLWQNWKCYLCIEQLLFYKAEWWVDQWSDSRFQSNKAILQTEMTDKCWKNFHISCSGYGIRVCEWSKIFRIEKLYTMFGNIHVMILEFHQEQKQIPTHRQPPQQQVDGYITTKRTL